MRNNQEDTRIQRGFGVLSFNFKLNAIHTHTKPSSTENDNKASLELNQIR